MVTRYSLDYFDDFTVRFIHSKVCQLICRTGFIWSDFESLVQDFAANLARRRVKFNPAKCTWHGFVVVVCENHFADLLQRRAAELRLRARETSLNRPIRDAEGERTEFGATIPAEQHARRTGQYQPSHEEVSDNAMDIADVLSSLPSGLCRIAALLMEGMSKEDIARELKKSTKTVYRRVARIRERFEKAGLKVYL